MKFGKRKKEEKKVKDTVRNETSQERVSAKAERGEGISRRKG